MKLPSADELFSTELRVINIGVKIFYDSLISQGVKVIHVDWHPPASGDMDLARLLEKLT
jgi:hypothetical protein